MAKTSKPQHYFVLHYVDGNTDDFNKECNRVSYTDPHYVLFKHNEDPDASYLAGERTLAIVPHREILKILCKEILDE